MNPSSLRSVVQDAMARRQWDELPHLLTRFASRLPAAVDAIEQAGEALLESGRAAEAEYVLSVAAEGWRVAAGARSEGRERALARRAAAVVRWIDQRCESGGLPEGDAGKWRVWRVLLENGKPEAEAYRAIQDREGFAEDCERIGDHLRERDPQRARRFYEAALDQWRLLYSGATAGGEALAAKDAGQKVEAKLRELGVAG